MKKLLSVIILSVLAFQFSSVASVFAAPGSADLRIDFISKVYAGTVHEILVCNDGDETVTSIDFDVEMTNFNLLLPFVAVANGTNTTSVDGTIDTDTIVWTGVMENTQCLSVMFQGEETGAIGENTTFDVDIVSSTLEGDIENIDPDLSDNSISHGPSEIVLPPDLGITTRLLTQGEIEVGTNVEYEVIISNVGPGALDAGGMNVSFVVPTSASFEEVIDENLDDELSLNMCFELGPPSVVGPGLSDLDGTIVVCLLNRSGALLPDTSYAFTFSMTATASFVSGEVSTFANVTGEDADSALIQRDISAGINPANGGYNNILLLPYNNDELTVTINRCPGQSFVTTNGSGCFRVSFNKLIWEPSFTVDDLILSGGGSITGFSKVNDFTWQVSVSGIPLNSTVSLSLEEGSVLDFSAVTNGTEVLGENVIRHEVEQSGGSDTTDGNTDSGTASAVGSLPATGTNTVAPNALAILLIGLGIQIVNRFKKTLNLVRGIAKH